MPNFRGCRRAWRGDLSAVSLFWGHVTKRNIKHAKAISESAFLERRCPHRDCGQFAGGGLLELIYIPTNRATRIAR